MRSISTNKNNAVKRGKKLEPEFMEIIKVEKKPVTNF